MPLVRWLTDFIGAPLPLELHATCGDCAMLAPPGRSGLGREDFFSPNTKCCTYSPRLANFLVGAILVDTSAGMAEGRAHVAEQIRRGVDVTPLGISAGGMLPRQGVFGRSESMRCPYYREGFLRGGCSIWKHRDSVCATWFCKHVRGATGKRFWNAAHGLLEALEKALSLHCLLALGLDDATIQGFFPATGQPTGRGRDAPGGDDPDRAVQPEAKLRRWGSWSGREETFFRECDRIVCGLKGVDLERIGGVEITLLARLARAAHREATTVSIPRRLEVGEFQVVGMGAGKARVATYSSFDPLEMPVALLDALPYFNGATAAEAHRAVRKGLGIAIEPALVGKLLDFGLLRRSGAPPHGRGKR